MIKDIKEMMTGHQYRIWLEGEDLGIAIWDEEIGRFMKKEIRDKEENSYGVYADEWELVN